VKPVKFDTPQRRSQRAFLIFLCVIVAEHLLMREYSGDAVAAFSHVLNSRTLLQALHYRYVSWTSRLLIEAPLMLLAHHMHTLIWAIMDIGVCAILWQALNKLTKSRQPWMVTALILIYPMAEMGSAGWMATTINYLWPLTLLLVALCSLQMMYQRQHIGWVLALIFLASELFATNFETVAAIYLIMLSFFSISMCCLRRVTLAGFIFVLGQWVIAGMNAVFALTCPGNWVRNDRQVLLWMKDFVSLTPVDKLVMGVNTTVLNLISNDVLFLIFACLLVLYAWRQHASHQQGVLILAIIPIASIAMVRVAPIIYPNVSNLIQQFLINTRVNGVNYYSPSSYLLFAWSMLIVASTLIVLFQSTRTLIEGGLLVTVLASGLVSRMIMGFSPTLYASGTRTFIFVDFALIYCSLIIIESLTESHLNSRLRIAGRYGMMVITIMSMIGNMLSIGIVK
jgi:hypothetical protein